MRVYPDTSVLVSAYTEESSSTIAEEWMASLRPGDVFSSAWCETEIASALAAKTRAGRLMRDRQQRLLAIIGDFLRETATLIPIDRHHFKAAADFLSRSSSNLRAGDALHLAIAADAGARLVTFDRRMAEAGVDLALDVHRLA